MLRAILNKYWRQHPTRHQLYGHLPLITKTIQVRQTRHVRIRDVALKTYQRRWMIDYFFCFCFVLRHINHKRSFNAGSVFEVNWCYFIFYYIFGIFCGEKNWGGISLNTLFSIYFVWTFIISIFLTFLGGSFVFLILLYRWTSFKYPSKFFWVCFIENLF